MLTEPRGLYTVPSMHKLTISFPACIDRQILLPKGGELEPSSVLMFIQLSLFVKHNLHYYSLALPMT